MTNSPTRKLIEDKANELTEIAHKYVYWDASMRALAKHVLASELKARIEELTNITVKGIPAYLIIYSSDEEISYKTFGMILRNKIDEYKEKLSEIESYE